MALVLHSHPLSSFCHKVLIALYENETPFESFTVDLFPGEGRDRFLELWPVGKIPVLRDGTRNRTVPETTIIIEYLEQHYPGSRPLMPADASERLDARLWDRFYDLYVQVPMQKIVGDRTRPEAERDPRGVADAKNALETAYGMIDRQLTGKRWTLGSDFSIADCAAAPALFYAGIVAPLAARHPTVSAYFERLIERPSVKRVIEEARPYFQYFPYREAMPKRFAP